MVTFENPAIGNYSTSLKCATEITKRTECIQTQWSRNMVDFTFRQQQTMSAVWQSCRHMVCSLYASVMPHAPPHPQDVDNIA